jgi:hypothetical protein
MQFHRFPMIDFQHEVFMIYDYASFTSSLADFPRFIDELGVFLKDTQVHVFDTHSGIQDLDLHDLLESYNSICNKDGEFDVSKVIHLEDGSSRIVLQHHVAGMLGVYGNITGSTALHGLVGMTIAGNEDRINTIGDDAGGIFDLTGMSIDEVKECIRVIGDISEEKFEVWEEDQEYAEDGLGWHFTKRPLNVRFGNVTTGWMPDFPIYPLLLAQTDEVHTVHEPSFHVRRRIAIRQSIRLIESMHCHLDLITDTDMELTVEFLKWLFQQMDLPIHGSLPSREEQDRSTHCYPDKFLATPVISMESIKEGWWRTLSERCWSETGYLHLPVTHRAMDNPAKMTQGLEFYSHGNRLLGVLEKIGVVRKTMLMEDRLVSEESLDRMYAVITGEVHGVYRFEVLRDYEPWESVYHHVMSK